MNRRCALRYSLGIGLSALSAPALARSLAFGKRFKIGACDWSIGPTGDSNAFNIAKQIGLDGVQVSLNTKTGPSTPAAASYATDLYKRCATGWCCHWWSGHWPAERYSL